MPEPVAITDQTGSLLELSAAFEKLFTLDRARLPTEAIEDVILPSRLRSAYRAARQTALKDGWSLVAGHINEVTAVRADGGEFAVEISVSRTSEDPCDVATWIRDLTEDRTFVAPTLRRAALYSQAEELAGFGSWEWRPETRRPG